MIQKLKKKANKLATLYLRLSSRQINYISTEMQGAKLIQLNFKEAKSESHSQSR